MKRKMIPLIIVLGITLLFLGWLYFRKEPAEPKSYNPATSFDMSIDRPNDTLQLGDIDGGLSLKYTYKLPDGSLIWTDTPPEKIHEEAFYRQQLEEATIYAKKYMETHFVVDVDGNIHTDTNVPPRYSEENRVGNMTLFKIDDTEKPQ